MDLLKAEVIKNKNETKTHSCRAKMSHKNSEQTGSFVPSTGLLQFLVPQPAKRSY